jgi:hypothetical protein
VRSTSRSHSHLTATCQEIRLSNVIMLLSPSTPLGTRLVRTFPEAPRTVPPPAQSSSRTFTLPKSHQKLTTKIPLEAPIGAQPRAKHQPQPLPSHSNLPRNQVIKCHHAPFTVHTPSAPRLVRTFPEAPRTVRLPRKSPSSTFTLPKSHQKLATEIPLEAPRRSAAVCEAPAAAIPHLTANSP